MKNLKKRGHLFSAAWSLVKDSYTEFSDDKAFKMAAALSYYTAFSLAPILIIMIAIAGFFFGQEAAQGQIVTQMHSLIGQDGAVMIQSMIKGAANQSQGIFASFIGLALLILGSLGVFIELQESLNIIWGVDVKPGKGVWVFFKRRIISFSLVVSLGFLSIVSLIINTLLSLMYNFIDSTITGFIPVADIINNIFSFVVITVMFAVIYKVLPDVILKWKYVGTGAIVTSFLFAAGKYFIGLYIGNSSYSSTFGAAGSLVALFVWIYYTGLIIYFGAEITQVYRKQYEPIELKPDSDAVLVIKITDQIKKALAKNTNSV